MHIGRRIVLLKMPTTVRSSVFNTSKITSPDEVVHRLTAEWSTTNKKRAVKPMDKSMFYRGLIPLLVPPTWPGSGALATVADDIPMVTIPGMPSEMYPRYTGALVAYTLAELFIAEPALIQSRSNPELIHTVTIVVMARVGTWASLGRAPSTDGTATSLAVRWSNANQCLVVRPGEPHDGTALWRHFLAIMPGLLEATTEAAAVVCGLAPCLFLCGVSRYVRSGEAYSLHYVERQARSHARASLSTIAFKSMKLDSPITWEVMSAAAIGGFSVSFIKQIASDPAFITHSDMCINPAEEALLSVRLEKLMASSNESCLGTCSDATTRLVLPAREGTRAAPDTMSVVDTEDGNEPDTEYSVMDRYMNNNSGTATPRVIEPVELPKAEVEEIRQFAKVAQSGAVPATSMKNMPEESLQW